MIDDIVFDETSHTSSLYGRDLPHVTSVLRAVGVSTDFDEIANLSSFAGENIQFARERGSIVHADCHAYDDSDLVIRSVDPTVLPYVYAWVDAREELGLTPVAHARERRLFHPLYFYTGILDGVFMRGDQLVLVDIKTGDPEHSACHLQTAAYELAWEVSYPDAPIAVRMAVQLVPTRRVPYRIKEYSARPDAASDAGNWLACLATYHQQASRRKRVL